MASSVVANAAGWSARPARPAHNPARLTSTRARATAFTAATAAKSPSILPGSHVTLPNAPVAVKVGGVGGVLLGCISNLHSSAGPPDVLPSRGPSIGWYWQQPYLRFGSVA